MGRATVPVVPQATVGILATGDELVPYQATPGVGQIRNSNEIMLIAQTARAGAKPLSLGIASDQETALQAAIQRGFESDILCLSGGVSMGTRDLVPAMLAELGVETIFHGCDMKPGKPIFFGALPAERASDHRPRWIFGLPGNPVSSMVCFELFVSTAIRRRMGISPATPHFEVGRLTESRLSKDSRPTYFPAEVQTAQDGLAVRPLNWRGSFDLQSTAHANGLVYFPTAREYAVGESVRVLRLDGRSPGCEKT
jgi:molybdopterin molybdotransferase